MSQDTKFEEPGDDELVNDEKLFRREMLHMYRKQRYEQKLVESQVWGNVHASPPTNGLVRDVKQMKDDHAEKVQDDKWFRRIVIGAFTTLGLGGLGAWISSHWH